MLHGYAEETSATSTVFSDRATFTPATTNDRHTTATTATTTATTRMDNISEAVVDKADADDSAVGTGSGHQPRRVNNGDDERQRTTTNRTTTRKRRWKGKFPGRWCFRYVVLAGNSLTHSTRQQEPDKINTGRRGLECWLTLVGQRSPFLFVPSCSLLQPRSSDLVLLPLSLRSRFRSSVLIPPISSFFRSRSSILTALSVLGLDWDRSPEHVHDALTARRERVQS